MGGVTTVVPPTVHQKVPYALACSSSQVLPHFCLVEGRKTEHNANRSDVLQMCKAVKSAPRCVLLHAPLCSQVVRPSVCPSVCPFCCCQTCEHDICTFLFTTSAKKQEKMLHTLHKGQKSDVTQLT